MYSILKIIVRNLSYQKLRTALTLLGVVIGIAAIVSLVTIGDALQNSINEQFEKIGTNKIIITPGAPTSTGFSGSTFGMEKLYEKDVDVVKRVYCVETAFGILGKTAKIEFGNEVSYGMVWGIPVDETKKLYEEMHGYEIDEGRDLKSSDRYSVVIGYLAKTKLFDREIKPRDRLKINGRTFKVAGTLKKIGNPMDDMAIVMPIGTARTIFNNTDEVSIIFVDVKKGFDVTKVSDDIKKELKRERGVEDFKIQTFGDIMKTATKILGIIQYLFVGIAAISLIVGGIGIMNIMLMTVIERTREIGIMKATGATNRLILTLFLGEAALVGLIGGLIGFALGFGTAFFISEYAGNVVGIPMHVSFSSSLFFGAILFSIIVGIISGTYPAYRASKLDPVDALRYE